MAKLLLIGHLLLDFLSKIDHLIDFLNLPNFLGVLDTPTVAEDNDLSPRHSVLAQMYNIHPPYAIANSVRDRMLIHADCESAGNDAIVALKTDMFIFLIMNSSLMSLSSRDDDRCKFENPSCDQPQWATVSRCHRSCSTRDQCQSQRHQSIHRRRLRYLNFRDVVNTRVQIWHRAFSRPNPCKVVVAC